MSHPKSFRTKMQVKIPILLKDSIFLKPKCSRLLKTKNK